MKVNVFLTLRLAIHVTIGLVLFGLAAGGGLAIITELLVPEEGDKQDTVVLTSMLVILAVFVIILGWSIGKPLFYIIGWISRLANGIYTEPELGKLYSSKHNRLKRPYSLYKELFLQLHTLSDVLERSRQERSRLDDMKREWIAGISHDLKTPLTYIKGYSSMLLSPQHEWSPEESTGFLQEIQQKADHMQELIGDLNLSFRLDEQQLPLKLERVDLIEFVRRIVVDAANDPRAADRSLSVEAAEERIETLLDAGLLQRALHNLLLNAILHNPAGTHIDIRISKSTDLRIVIKDDGVGMDEQAIDGLFNKYYRGTSTEFRSEGTGLGMAIAKQLVLAHGGNIQVTSVVGEGTAVTVTLPLHN